MDEIYDSVYQNVDGRIEKIPKIDNNDLVENPYYEANLYLNNERNQKDRNGIVNLEDTEVVTAVVDINDVYNYRSAVISRSHQASAVEHYPRINVDLSLGGQCELPLTPYIEPRCVLSS